MTNPCLHQDFEVSVAVGRLRQNADGPITHFTADIKINCRDCNLPFEFLGLGMGSSAYEPKTSVDGQELRAPIKPLGAPPPPPGLAGYSIHPWSPLANG